MIKIFVGCSPDGHDAESAATLEYSLRSRSSAPVDITWMIASRDPASPWSGWDMRRHATPFSGFRWHVPALCGYQGRAIYMDSDTICLADIAELWNTPIAAGKVVIARDPTRFCVSLWDCTAARPHMLPLGDLKAADGHQRQSAYFRTRGELVQRFDAPWNYLDTVDTAPLADAKVLHYTDMSTQPSSRHARARLSAQGLKHWYDGPVRPHPRHDVVQRFELEYAKSRDAGFTPERYIPTEHYGEYKKRSLKDYAGGGHHVR